MDVIVARLLKEAVDDLVKLEIALFFQRSPGYVDGAQAIAKRIYRDQVEVERSLQALAKTGLLERFELGSGRYVLYSLTQDPQSQQAVDLLSTAYHESEHDRLAIIRVLMQRRPVVGASVTGDG